MTQPAGLQTPPRCGRGVRSRENEVGEPCVILTWFGASRLTPASPSTSSLSTSWESGIPSLSSTNGHGEVRMWPECHERVLWLIPRFLDLSFSGAACPGGPLLLLAMFATQGLLSSFFLLRIRLL